MAGNTQKKMEVLHSSSFRDMVNQVNTAGIEKDSIVQIVPREEDGVFLFYYN